jgi:hypothetical protein
MPEAELIIRLIFDANYLPGCTQTWDDPGEKPGWEIWNPCIVIDKRKIPISDEMFEEIKKHYWDSIETQME